MARKNSRGTHLIELTSATNETELISPVKNKSPKCTFTLQILTTSSVKSKGVDIYVHLLTYRDDNESSIDPYPTVLCADYIRYESLSISPLTRAYEPFPQRPDNPSASANDS